MNIHELRKQRKHLHMENRKLGPAFVAIDRSQWPTDDGKRFAVWRNNRFLVQAFDDGVGALRLSICRSELDDKGNWRDGLTWDELQQIKNAVGFSDFDAVEVYPAQSDVVNVANMRHLWIMTEQLKFAWRAKRPK